MQSDICVLDDFFPNLLTGFRVAEYNAYLAEFEHLQILSNYGHFAVHHAQYAAQYPQFAARVREFSPQALSGFGLAYLNFLNNAVMYLPYLTQAQLPFVMTLFPGGGFGLHEPESDAKLLEVLTSPWLRAVVLTQLITRDYVLDFLVRHKLPPISLQVVTGLTLSPTYFDMGERVWFGAGKTQMDICFVAEKYMPAGVNKGYPEFIAAAHQLAATDAGLHFHVVGNFDARDVDVQALGERIRFYGRLNTPELKAFFLNMDLIVSPNRPYLLHPGNFDGFPTGCCMEAALCGVAIMATDVLHQNPGYPPGQAIFPLPDEPVEIVPAIVQQVRQLLAAPEQLAHCARQGQRLTRVFNAPGAQLGPRMALLRAYAHAF